MRKSDKADVVVVIEIKLVGRTDQGVRNKKNYYTRLFYLAKAS